jgi:hypothetical protein
MDPQVEPERSSSGARPEEDIEFFLKMLEAAEKSSRMPGARKDKSA